MSTVAVDPTALVVAAIVLLLAGVGAGRWRKQRRAAPAPAAPIVSTESQLLDLVEKGGNTGLVMEGGFHLREAFVSPNGFTVRGALHLHDDSMLDGVVEVFGNVTLGDRANAKRPMLVHGDLTLGKDASMPCCQVDGNVFFHPGSKIEGALKCDAVYLIENAQESAVVMDGEATRVGGDVAALA